jgi:N-acetyl-anhydromuramyl-L-alanine amidase AmpD
VSIPFIQARFYSPANRTQVDWIIVHDMEAGNTPGRALEVANWFAGPDSPQASAHYSVDLGAVVQSVREQDIAWQVQSTNDLGNRKGIGIEHAGFASQTPEQWASPDSEAMLERSAALTADIAKRWGIPLQWVDAEGLQRGERGFTTHNEITQGLNGGVGHTDPGPSFPFEHYLDLVRGAAAPSLRRMVTFAIGGVALGAFARYLYLNRQYLPAARTRYGRA